MTISPATFWKRRTRRGGILLCALLFTLLLFGAMSIPFLFESLSIEYKSGLPRTLLRGGKLVGMIAALLLMVQLLLVTRIKSLNQMVAMDRLIAIHKANGIAIALLALVHPLLIFAPEEITTLPLEMAFWPEIIGAILLMGLFYMTASALYKKELEFPFNFWMGAHKIGGPLLLSILFTHLLFSSETFEEGAPRLIGLGFSLVCLGLLTARHLEPMRGLSPWVVSQVSPAGDRATRLRLSPTHGAPFHYLPGQFAFLSFPASPVSPEAHPFTIASSPTTPEAIEFVIGKSGDWTKGVPHIKTGDTAIIDGPYGFFTHRMLEDSAPLVLIAGGIGITPMLSMIRDLHATHDPRKIILIWSNRSEGALFAADELDTITQDLPSLSIHLLFTDQSKNERLTAPKLRQFMQGLSTPQVFLCGPPPMMVAVRAMLKEIGIHKHRIHSEIFGF